MVSLALVAELESLRFAATLGSTSQRLNLQVGQVVNCARDILRYNGSTFSRNAPTSFRAESTLHGSFPKIPRLAGASRHRNVPPKEVCKYQYREEKKLRKCIASYSTIRLETLNQYIIVYRVKSCT